MNQSNDLYTFGIDFTGVPDELYVHSGHGLWMATVLREIAPECDIYALNAVLYEEGLSYQDQEEGGERARDDYNFIHNDHPPNLWPFGCFPFHNDQNFTRTPDLNVFHFDYNALFVEQYGRYAKF